MRSAGRWVSPCARLGIEKQDAPNPSGPRARRLQVPQSLIGVNQSGPECRGALGNLPQGEGQGRSQAVTTEKGITGRGRRCTRGCIRDACPVTIRHHRDWGSGSPRILLSSVSQGLPANAFQTSCSRPCWVTYDVVTETPILLFESIPAHLSIQLRRPGTRRGSWAA